MGSAAAVGGTAHGTQQPSKLGAASAEVQPHSTVRLPTHPAAPHTLQPLDGVQVQMVGGLIQQQKVGILGGQGRGARQQKRLAWCTGQGPHSSSSSSGSRERCIARLAAGCSNSRLPAPNCAASTCMPAMLCHCSSSMLPSRGLPRTLSRILPRHMRICQPPLYEATSRSLSSGPKPSSGIIWREGR